MSVMVYAKRGDTVTVSHPRGDKLRNYLSIKIGDTATIELGHEQAEALMSGLDRVLREAYNAQIPVLEATVAKETAKLAKREAEVAKGEAELAARQAKREK